MEKYNSGSLYVLNPNPGYIEDREFRIFYYQCDSKYLGAFENRTFISRFPKKLIDSLFTMLSYPFSAEELSDGSCQINVLSSKLFNRQYAHIVEVMLQRTIFRISLVQAQEILKKFSFEINVWKIEEYGEYCLVVLSPDRWSTRGPIEPDFDPDQPWTRFRNEVVKLTASKSASATVQIGDKLN